MALLDYKPMMERCSNCSSCKWIPFDKVKSARFAQIARASLITDLILMLLEVVSRWGLQLSTRK